MSKIENQIVYFVGRKKEINKINRTLEAGYNIIVHGKYGMGRTSLVRQISRLNRDRWQFWFADASQTPEKICRQLFKELFPDEKHRYPLKYKSLRQRISAASQSAKLPVVLVLDNIATITSARIELLRHLAANGNFAFIAIVDDSLDQQEELQLRGALQLTCQVFLSYLSLAEIGKYYQHYSSKFRWNWSDETLKSYSRLTRGYPLFMTESIVELKTEFDLKLK
ncbi:MAG: ATP-binding protein [bacterium]|nr:ATP-binding protein [bacterium]